MLGTFFQAVTNHRQFHVKHRLPPPYPFLYPCDHHRVLLGVRQGWVQMLVDHLVGVILEITPVQYVYSLVFNAYPDVFHDLVLWFDSQFSCNHLVVLHGRSVSIKFAA